jgi:hypothetical protein
MKRSHIVITLSCILALLTLAIVSPFFVKLIHQPAAVSAADQSALNSAAKNPNGSVAPPAVINAVYVTGYSAGTKTYRAYLTNLFKTTSVNAVIIDIKDYSGTISYNSQVPQVQQYHLYDGAIPDIDSLIQWLHGQHIYVIGRITTFEDPSFAKANPQLAIYNTRKTTDRAKPILWTNAGGLQWMDPSSKIVWDYNIALANDAISRGFDEINFDYVRFPTDGDTSAMGFPVWDGVTPESTIIKNFFEYVRAQMPGKIISADLFGQTTSTNGDMGIGQLFQSALGNFNYVDPMVYPSEYINGFLGFPNPAEHPYDVVNFELNSAVKKEQAFYMTGESADSPAASAKALAPQTIIRPWLQDYNVGAVYNTVMVSNEIQATKDALGPTYAGFMLWNAGNVYTQGALLKTTSPGQ